jgi:PAS domain S-box-containing protein
MVLASREECHRQPVGTECMWGLSAMFRLIMLCWLFWTAGSAIAAGPDIVRVGIAVNPPIATVAPDGTYGGLGIDVIRDIAGDEGWSLDLVNAPFPDLLDQLEDGRLDVLVGLARTDERARRFRFTGQTLVSNWGVIYRRPDVAIDTITDLEGLRVAVVQGSTHTAHLIDLAGRFGITIGLVETGNYREAFEAVDAGRAETAAVSRLFGLLNATSHDVTETAIVFNPVEVAFAGPADANPRIIDAIDSYLQAGKTGTDPRLRRHLAQLFGAAHPVEEPVWLYVAIGGTVFLFTLAAAIAFWLKREVSRQTRSLETSERELSEIIEKMPDPFYRTDARGTVLLASPSCFELLGYHRDEIIGRNLADFYVHPEQRADIIDKVIAGGGKPVLIEADLRHKQGHAVTVSSRAFARYDGEGRYIGIDGISRDISERIAAEQAVRTSEERYQLAMTQAAVWDWDLVTGKLYCSPYLREILGYSEAEFADVISQTISSIVHPDERETFLEEVAAMRSDPGYRYHTEHRYRLRDGSFRWFESRGHCLFDEAGRPVRAVGMMVDIDNRRQAEATTMRLGRILERSFNEILLFDPSTLRFVSANEGACENLGYEVSELAAMTPVDIHPGMTLESFTALIAPLRDGRRSSVSYEADLQRRDGTEYPADLRVELIREAEPAMFVAFATDISDRRAKDRQLLQALKTAEEANKAKSEFLASMSHELRTPLNAILGFAQMMELDAREPLGPHQRESISSILKGGSHLLDLVNDILDLARIEAEQVAHTIERVSVNETVSDCLDLVRTLSERRGILLNDRVSDGPELEVDTDRLRFKQCLLNLLSNAIKYNVENGSVEIRADLMPTGFVRLSVRDTGIGIPAAEHAGIFRMFHRVDADPMVTREGTGIGLSVTRALVEQLAGRTGFTSEAQSGSTFWFELPLAGNDNVLIWTPEMRTGIDPVDRDNQAMAGIVNRLSQLTAEDVESANVIGEALDHVRYALGRVQVTMEVCGFSENDAWQHEFRRFIADFSARATDFQRKRDAASLAACRQALRNWWITHIATVGARLAPQARGRDRDIRQALVAAE